MAGGTAAWAPLIRQFSQQYGIDPRAALAVAQMEGLSGRVGDGGHAFGPFQMNDAGGVLTGRPGDHRAYAESPAGIRDAVAAMARNGAKGLSGAAAVRAIVNNYERPAAPGKEIAGALARYGGRLPAGTSTTYAPASARNLSAAGAADPLQARRFALLGQIFARDAAYTGVAAPTLPQPYQLPGGSTPTQAAPRALAARTATSSGIKWVGDTSGVHPQLLSSVAAAARSEGATQIRVSSGYRSAAHNAAVGGVSHSNHTTGDALDGEAYVPGRGWIPLGTLLRSAAGRFGLRSGDQPGFFNGNPDPVHVDDGANVRS